MLILALPELFNTHHSESLKVGIHTQNNNTTNGHVLFLNELKIRSFCLNCTRISSTQR